MTTTGEINLATAGGIEMTAGSSRTVPGPRHQRGAGTRRHRARRLVAVLAALGLFAVAGCSGIPGSGPVQDIRQIGDVVEPASPQAPQPGQLPDQIVRGFIDAAADTNDVPYAAAKQFLTPQAQLTWQSGPTPVVVLDDLFRLEVTDTATVALRGTQIGALGTDRAYQAMNPRPYTHVYHLTKVEGQWRIADPQSEVLIQNQQFDDAFRQRTVYFLDGSGSVVVPDLRYLEGGLTPANRITRLVNLLLAGPSERLRPGVVSRLGPTAELRSNVTTDDAEIVHVDLKGVSVPTPDAKSGLAAQIVWTLYPDASRVAISVDGVPLTGSDANANLSVYTPESVDSYNPDRVPGTGQAPTDPWFVDTSGAIISLSQDLEPMWGKVGTGSYVVSSAAMSAANGTLAAVTVGTPDNHDGRQLVLGRPLDHLQTTPVLVADQLTPPTFTRTGDEVWAVQNGSTKPQVIAITTGGNPVRSLVQADGLAGLGDVTQLVLSPDGTRVAVVAGGRLYLGVVIDPVPSGTVTETTGPRIEKLVEIAPSLTNVGPVTFAAADLLIVGADSGSGLRILYQVGVDGRQVVRTSDNGFFGDVQSVSVAPGQPVLMSYGGRVYQLDGGWRTGQWITPLNQPVLQGSAPFYPR